MRFLIFLLIGSFLVGCNKENCNSNDLKFNSSFEIANGQILHNNAVNVSIYFDSVLEDGRCPIGSNCLWEGNAKVSFNFISNHKVSNLELNTHNQFQTDTIVNGYKIELISLSPYPTTNVKIAQNEYRATIIISK